MVQGEMMKYFFDTEFIEDSKTIDLISIGIVAEDGREFYSLNYDCNHSLANNWVKENVLIQLPDKNRKFLAIDENDLFGKYASHQKIKLAVLEFTNPDLYGKPEFWAYYADYDWVVFCQLFGTMMDLPDGFPMYCRDLQQEVDRLGIDNLPSLEGGSEHNALHNAREVRYRYDWLQLQSLY